MIDESASTFEQFTYTDEETGITLEYSLYIPEGYEEGTDTRYIHGHVHPDLPSILFPPARLLKNTMAQLSGQAMRIRKRSSFVLVPAYTGTVTDDNWNASEQLDATVNLIIYLTENYSIDQDRFLHDRNEAYGLHVFLYLNSKYPDLFGGKPLCFQTMGHFGP